MRFNPLADLDLAAFPLFFAAVLAAHLISVTIGAFCTALDAYAFFSLSFLGLKRLGFDRSSGLLGTLYLSSANELLGFESLWVSRFRFSESVRNFCVMYRLSTRLVRICTIRPSIVESVLPSSSNPVFSIRGLGLGIWYVFPILLTTFELSWSKKKTYWAWD